MAKEGSNVAEVGGVGKEGREWGGQPERWEALAKG